MNIEPLKAYAEARIEILLKSPDSPIRDAAILELQMVVTLADGLIKQEALIRSALNKRYEGTP